MRTSEMSRHTANEPDNATHSGGDAELRAEIERLKRRLDEQERAHAASHSPLKHPPRPSAAKIFMFLLVVAFLFAVAFVAGYLPHQRQQLQLTAEAKVQEETLPQVSIATAVRGSVMGLLELPGNIQPVTEAPILARAEGYIKKRYVDIGDQVTAGELLADIDAPDLDQQVRQAAAAVDEAEADLDRSTAALEQGKANEQLAEVTASRWKTLVARGVVSKQENDQYQSQFQAQVANVRALDRAVAAAKGTLAAARANVARLTDMQGYLNVRAPFAGVVTQRNVDVGALVTAGNTLLFRIAQTNLLRTYVNVPQVNAQDVHAGQTAVVSTSELPNRKFAGTVTRTSNALDPASRTLLVEVQVPNPEGKLLPGMYVDVDLNLPRKEPPLLISSDTLVVHPGGTMVALLDAKNSVHFQPITIGTDYGDKIEVLAGLKPGDRAIVNPNDAIEEGARVRPVPAASAAR